MLNVTNLAAQRGSQYLFRNLSFNLAAGECLLIKGPNGSGKSTLLKTLAGLCSPQKGQIQWHPSPYSSSLSYLGHKDGLRKALTPYENLSCQLKINRVSHDFTSGPTIAEILKKFEILACCQLPCALLSAGQSRKVSLAAIVLLQKKIWILDEPFSSLDKKSSEALLQCMQQQLANQGIIILASHFFDFDFPLKVIELGT